MFSKALLTATYKNGKPGQLTEEHEKAEHHRFKTEYLFKNKKILKDLYVSRLIQHFLIIQTLENQLQNLSESAQSEISAFFALSYLDHLWRTPGIDKDLRQLNVNPDAIQENEKTKTTQTYLKNIENFPPKILLAHFLLHVAGFMHGGNIILSKYIEPSNRLTRYTIPANQYDFSSALSLFSTKKSPITLYHNMMKEIDNIKLDTGEYNEVVDQCKGIYGTMASIYDDLCTMHSHQPKLTVNSVAVFSVVMVTLALLLKFMCDFFNPMSNPAVSKPL